MANVTIRKDGGEHQAQLMTEWDPLRTMRNMLRWDPFREMTQLWPEERFGMLQAPGYAPAFDVKETRDAYVLKADLPGTRESDLEITLTGNRLTIGGKREAETEEKGDTFYVYERAAGAFTRSFTMPTGINADAISAHLDRGVLTVTVGKKPEVQAKRIAVGGDKPKS